MPDEPKAPPLQETLSVELPRRVIEPVEEILVNEEKRSTLAIAALIIGIFAVLTVLIGVFTAFTVVMLSIGSFLGALAIVLGIKALSEQRNVALAGICLGAMGVCVSFAVFLVNAFF